MMLDSFYTPEFSDIPPNPGESKPSGRKHIKSFSKLLDIRLIYKAFLYSNQKQQVKNFF